MITGTQCRAARALVEISTKTLAQLARTEVAVVEAFERQLAKPETHIISQIQAALEITGAVFLDESKDGGGAGVRLKFDRSSTRRISILEGEGGIIGWDDVP